MHAPSWRLAPWARGYRAKDLFPDALAGLLVAALAVPQSLGYAAVAGVPVQVGLWTLPPALLAYALFGSSRLLSIGPVSTVSVLSGSVVRQLSGGDPEQAIRLTAALAIIAGVILVLAGLLRVGWVARFLSEPIVTGFVAGLVVLIVVGELPGLLGMAVPGGNLFERIGSLAQQAGAFHGLTLLTAAIALAVLFIGSSVLPRAPWALIVLVLGVVLSALIDLGGRGVAVVGEVPAGLPAPFWPFGGLDEPLSQLGSLVTAGAAVAAVGLAEGLAAARTFADRQEQVRDDAELVGNGAADLASGFFGGMGVGGSLSKTAANVRAGARTQASGVAAALVVVVVLLFATGLLTDLPKAVLSAIVVHAVWNLVHPKRFLEFKKVRRNDFVAAMVALGGVLVLGPLNGLLLAVAQSLLGLIYRTLQVSVDEMGKIPGEKGAWGSIDSDPERHRIPGVLVLRPEGQVFWANASPVFEAVRGRLPLDGGEQMPALVLDLGSTGQLDSTTVDLLRDLLERVRDVGGELYLVRIVDPVRQVMDRSGFTDELGADHIWHSIPAAVKAARPTPS